MIIVQMWSKRCQNATAGPKLQYKFEKSMQKQQQLTLKCLLYLDRFMKRSLTVVRSEMFD